MLILSSGKLVGFDQMCEEFGLDELNSEFLSDVLQEAGRLGSEVIAPLNIVGDEKGVTMDENGERDARGSLTPIGNTLTMDGRHCRSTKNTAARACPNCLGTATEEIWQSSNISFSLCPLLTHGAVDALEKAWIR